MNISQNGRNIKRSLKASLTAAAGILIRLETPYRDIKSTLGEPSKSCLRTQRAAQIFRSSSYPYLTLSYAFEHNYLLLLFYRVLTDTHSLCTLCLTF